MLITSKRSCIRQKRQGKARPEMKPHSDSNQEAKRKGGHAIGMNLKLCVIISQNKVFRSLRSGMGRPIFGLNVKRVPLNNLPVSHPSREGLRDNLRVAL